MVAERLSVTITNSLSPTTTGNVRNVRMLSCGMIVWDAPEDASCCQDKLTYKVRFLYGTDFNRATETEKKVMAVDTSWIKFTANDLPEGRPLQVLVGLYEDTVWALQTLENQLVGKSMMSHVLPRH